MSISIIHNVLTDILDITNYPGDKEKFINKFISNCTQFSVLNSVQELSEEKKDSIKQLLADLAHTQPDYKQLGDLIGQDLFLEKLEQVWQQELKLYLQAIVGELNQMQRQALLKYSNNL